MTKPAAHQSPTKYETVAEALQERIHGLQPRDSLPTERELMREFGVSRATVRRAIARLITRGAVYNIQGSGTYVADPDVVSKTLRLTSFSEDMRQRRLVATSTVLTHGTAAASMSTARRLGVPPGTAMRTVRRLRLADQQPMALETVEIVEELLDWDTIDLTASLYEHLESLGIQVVRAAQTIEAVNLDAEQARHLDQAVGAAALRVTRVSVDRRAQPVEYAETLYRADRYSFDTIVLREV